MENLDFKVTDVRLITDAKGVQSTLVKLTDVNTGTFECPLSGVQVPKSGKIFNYWAPSSAFPVILPKKNQTVSFPSESFHVTSKTLVDDAGEEYTIRTIKAKQ